MEWKKGVMIAAMLFAGLCCSATENVKKKKEKPQWEPRVAYRFHSISMKDQGTLGWAESHAFGTGGFPTLMGRIFVYHLYLPQGNVRNGMLYPMKTEIWVDNRFYPCYRTTP